MIIYVEGNIGCGKSTVLSNFGNNCKDDNIKIVQEGLADWLNVKDASGNILDHFYKDKAKFSFPLQMVILSQRHFYIKDLIHQLRTQGQNDFVLIIERSPASCDQVFRKILPISDLEHSAFDFIYNRMQQDEDSLGLTVHYVYLDLPAERCLDRIHVRARQEEISPGLNLAYLQQLQSQYSIIKDKSTVINADYSQDAVLKTFRDVIASLIVNSQQTRALTR